ncbi:MAG: flagellar filament capping protein FliD [Oscillospiraceae bacterium]|nr:flagellar filament capping protein FliD [Oscillospiraceae bacterium]
MASINSLSGGGSSGGIYGTRNVLSGLASGLDTESMIENAVSGYQMKLSALQQKKTKVEWEQEAYRSMITKMVGFSQKYTSYTSGTNLLSGSFFDNATKVTTLGANASKVSATGRTNSNVQINSVTSLASAAKYTVSAGVLGSSGTASKYVNIEGDMYVGKLDGILTLSYGNKSVLISFDESDAFATAEEMAAAINKKLEDEVIAFDSGSQEKASERIKAEVVDGKITIGKVKENDGNTVKISGAGGNLGTALGIGTIGTDDTVTSFEFDKSAAREKDSRINVLHEKGFSIKYNGKNYAVKGPSAEELEAAEGDTAAEKYINALQKKINTEIGENTIDVSNAYTGSSGSHLQLSFTLNDAADSTIDFTVSTSMAEMMGMEGGLSNKLNLSRTLEDVLGSNAAWDSWNPETEKDSNGEPIEGGKTEYDLMINGKAVKVTKDMTLQQLMDKLNSDEKSAVKMNYSSFTDQITFTTKEFGADQKIEFSGMAEALFGTVDVNDKKAYTEGADAKLTVTVDGAERTITRSSNTVDIDGLQVTLKGTFGEGVEGSESSEAVSFSFSSDSDKIVDAIKEMVKDYNAMMTEIKDAYSTMPLKNSKGQDYMPLTDEDAADMSESAIANYEKKAKTGLLFADRDLSSFYSNMTEALRAFGVTGNDGSGIGITTSYSNGTTTLVVDESALRAALDNNPEKVRDVFVGKNGNGGVMQKMKNQLDTYAGTTGAIKGILINKAGSTLAPTSIYQNALQKEIDSFEDEIESWQDKIADKIDYYNKKFTTLEKLIAQMNNQSSMLGGLSGGY